MKTPVKPGVFVLCGLLTGDKLGYRVFVYEMCPSMGTRHNYR